MNRQVLKELKGGDYMERVMTEEERIRRAEEIYNRRRYEGKVRVSTS